MSERPILFSAPMVNAILAGNKTQTRRIVKKRDIDWLDEHQGLREPDNAIRCPYGQRGDRLWVRETWQYYDWTEEGEPCIRFAADNATTWPEPGTEEWSDRLADVWEVLSRDNNFNIDNRARDRRWRPSIHMPRWASRITLEIVSVRVERLQDISEADAMAEGTPCYVCSSALDGSSESDCHCFHRKASASDYRNLWESINGAGSWEVNPFVWVVEFRRI